jgi:hypothetical protein
MGLSNAERQARWRERQKAKLDELERQVLTIRPRRPRRAKPTGEANDFIRELLDFSADYTNRANVWREKVRLDAEDQQALWETIHHVVNELSELAKGFLPTRKRKAAKSVEAEHGTMLVAKPCAPRRRVTS